MYIKNNKVRSRTRIWIGAFVDIASGIVSIVTFGFCNPLWGFKLCHIQIKRDIKFKEKK